MTSRSWRASALFIAVAATTTACLLAPTSTAAAATTVETAAAALGFGANRVTELTSSGDITSVLATEAKSEGSATQAHVIHLSGASVTVNAIIRPANHVYLVVEPKTRVSWRGANTNLLRFASDAGRVTGGVYGGIWDGAGRGSTNLIHLGNATVRLAELTVTHAGKNGIAAYGKSSLTLSTVTATDNESSGVYVAESSNLTASGLQATSNQRNGVQLAGGSVGSITNSVLDRNGQAVKGSTTGKTGHGLGVASGSVTVVSSSMSGNEVCGVSLTDGADATISGYSHLDRNGRHGLGTVPGSTATVSDSTVASNGYNGVLASGRGTRVALQRVAITSTNRSGLSVPSGGTATMEGTTISGPRTGSNKYNISVSGKGRLKLLSGNTISRSRSHGITVSGKGRIEISGAGNLIASNRGDGLRLTGSGTTGRISASVTFRDNRRSAIVVVSRAKLEMVTTCIYSGNTGRVEKRSGGRVSSL